MPTTTSRKAAAKLNRAFARQVAASLHAINAKEGYIALASTGPYDHNRYDLPLPSAEAPRVFRALHEAVDFAREVRRWGWRKVKIERVDGTTIGGTGVLAGTVVWRSWDQREIEAGRGWEPG